MSDAPDQNMGPTLGSLATFGILKVDMVAVLPMKSGLCRCCSLENLGLLARAPVRPEGSARRRACRNVMLGDGSGRRGMARGGGGEEPMGLGVWYLLWHVGTGSRGSFRRVFLVDLKRER